MHQYLGIWQNATGERLIIERAGEHVVNVTFLRNGEPIARPWLHGKPSTSMIGREREPSELTVELWAPGRGYTLEIVHEAQYRLRSGPVEALVVGISRYERDRFLAQYSPLFGGLEYFTRVT